MEGEARMKASVLGALALVLLLGACGKIGPIKPPGPADQITYPRPYPSH